MKRFQKKYRGVLIICRKKLIALSCWLLLPVFLLVFQSHNISAMAEYGLSEEKKIDLLRKCAELNLILNQQSDQLSLVMNDVNEMKKQLLVSQKIIENSERIITDYENQITDLQNSSTEQEAESKVVLVALTDAKNSLGKLQKLYEDCLKEIRWLKFQRNLAILMALAGWVA